MRRRLRDPLTHLPSTGLTMERLRDEGDPSTPFWPASLAARTPEGVATHGITLIQKMVRSERRRL